MMPRRMGVALNAISQAKSLRTIAIFRLVVGRGGGGGICFLLIPNRRTGKCTLDVKQVAYMHHTSCMQHGNWVHLF